MKRVAAVASMCCALLVGCAAYEKGAGSVDPKNPRVTVKDGQIDVPLFLYFSGEEKEFRVTWHLPADSRLRFPDNGIVIEGALTEKLQRVTVDKTTQVAVVLDTNQNEIIDCRPEKQGLAFSCFNRRSRPGIYKYTIRVRDGDRTLERDPYIMN
ncbi:MAG TPA: hypothetical protein VFR86_20455 [Burkholderiaceae bacterium]|nr:hypothetical protein [Burkholderiaceae bacterium]